VTSQAIGEGLAAALADRDVLARIGGPVGEAARHALAQLESLPAGARRATRVAWAAAVRAPVPAGIRGADPSWIEAALAQLPAAARDAIASGVIDEVSVWLARWTCAAIPILPAPEAARVTVASIEEAVKLRGAALRAWLDSIGLDQLAYALGPRVRETSTVLGERLVRAATRIHLAPRVGELGPRRSAIERARGELDELSLLRIAARAIAPHTDPISRHQLAVRLPRDVGSVLLSELADHAAVPIAHVPTWRALAAG
jgi:hypothetical protein